MQRLSSNEHIQAVEEASARVFRNLDAYEVVFVPEIECRVVLFPVDDFRLTKDQFLALGRAAKAVGDQSAYLFDVEQWPKYGFDRRRREYWLLALDDEHTYENPPDDANLVIMQNAIVSTAGRWGLVISDENHAIVGGSRDFVSRLLAALEVSKNEMKDLWVEHWQTNLKELGYETAWLTRQVEELSGAN